MGESFWPESECSFSASLRCTASIAVHLRSQAVHGPARPSTSRSLAMTPSPTQRCIPVRGSSSGTRLPAMPEAGDMPGKREICPLMSDVPLRVRVEFHLVIRVRVAVPRTCVRSPSGILVAYPLRCEPPCCSSLPRTAPREVPHQPSTPGRAAVAISTRSRSRLLAGTPALSW